MAVKKKVLYIGRGWHEVTDKEIQDCLGRCLGETAEIVSAVKPEGRGRPEDYALIIVVMDDMGGTAGLDSGDASAQKPAQRTLVEDVLLDSNWSKLPHVLLLGYEQYGLEDRYDAKDYGRLSRLQLFTRLCPEYYSYLPGREAYALLSNKERVESILCGSRWPNPYLGFDERVKNIDDKLIGPLRSRLSRICVGTADSEAQGSGDWCERYRKELRSSTLSLREQSRLEWFEYAGGNLLKEEIEGVKRQESHGKIDILPQAGDLLAAAVRHQKRCALTGRADFNICLIEDNPEGWIYHEAFKLEDVLTRFINFEGVSYSLWGPRKLPELRKHLKAKFKASIEGTSLPGDRKWVKPEGLAGKDSSVVSAGKCDLILVDILLRGVGGEFYDGLDFVKLLTDTYPEIPVLVMSKSLDAGDIRRAADYRGGCFVVKERALTMPMHYYDYSDGLGRLAWLIRDDKLRRNLIGNIRYWQAHPELLWHGNKCHHLVDHRYAHAANLWRLADELLYPVLTAPGFARDESFDEDLYAFCMAIWLHDIGHKGNKLYGDPFAVRQRHFLISAELILNHPEDYGLVREGGGHTENVPGDKLNTIWGKRHTGRYSVAEKVALISAYHNKAAPFCPPENAESLLDGFVGKDTYGRCVLALTSEESEQGFVKPDSTLARYAAALRLLDALDMGIGRIGGVQERKIRLAALHDDRLFWGERLREHIASADVEESVVDEIIDGKLNPREFFKEHAGLRNDSQLRMLVDELAFMASSPGYYDLHAAIDCVEIRCAGVGLPKKVGVELRFRLAQDELSDVKQHGIEGKTYPVYLAGNDGKSGYIGKKIAEARKSLEAWLDFDSVDCHPVS